jgi:hypothetical protein
VVLAASLALGAMHCAAPLDPQLEGPWRETPSATPATQAITSVESRVTFGGDGALTLSEASVYSLDAPSFAGCTETYRSTGLRWSVEGADTVNVDGTSAVTVERSGCAAASDDAEATPATGTAPFAAGTSSSASSYRVHDGTLTITAPDGTVRTYVRS